MPAAKRDSLLPLLLPVLLLAALELRALDYGFVWVDKGEIEHGSLIRPLDELGAAFGEGMQGKLGYAGAGVQQPYYRPLQVVLVSVVHAAFDPDEHAKRPRAYRAVSLGLGLATVWIFALLCRALLGSSWAGALAGGLFAAHPVLLEVYVWIAGISAALAALFVVSSLLLALAALRQPRAPARFGLALGACGLFVLGLLSKESAAVTPALVAGLALSLAALRRKRESAGAPLFLGTAAGLVAAQGALAAGFVLWWRPRVLGGGLTSVPPLGNEPEIQLLSGIASWPSQLAWLVWPLHSNTSDVVRVVASRLDGFVLLGAALALASALVWLWLVWRGRGAAALGLLWIWLAFLPTSGLVPLLHVRAERNLFFSAFGWALLGAALAHALAARTGLLARRAVVVCACVLVAGLAQRTWARTPDWRSTTHLFTRDVEREPNHREGRFHLAIAQVEAGRLERAIPHLEQLVATRSQFGAAGGVASYLPDTDVLALYCEVHTALRRYREPVALFDGEFRGEPGWARYYPGFFACAAGALESVGRCREAIDVVERMLPLAALPPAVPLAAARCHVQLGELAKARARLAALGTGPLGDPAAEAERARLTRTLREPRAGGARRPRIAPR